MIGNEAMKKIVFGMTVLLASFFVYPNDDLKLSDTAKMICINHENKESCEGFINTGIILAFNQGRIAGICELMEKYGEEVKEEQKGLCEKAFETEKDVKTIKY